MNDRTIGDRIRLLRAGERLSLRAFGVKVAAVEGRSEPWAEATVSDWEHGRSVPSVLTLTAIAKVSNARPEWVILRSGQPSLAA